MGEVVSDASPLLPPFLRNPTNPVTAGMPSAANTQDLSGFDEPRSPTVPASGAPGHLNGDQFPTTPAVRRGGPLPPLPATPELTPTGHTPGTQPAAMARLGLTAQAQQFARTGMRNTSASMRSDLGDLTASNRAGMAAARATVSAPWTPAGHAPGSQNQGFPLAPPNPANRVPRPAPAGPPSPPSRVSLPGGPAAPPPPAAPPQVPAGGVPSPLPGGPGVPGAPAGAPQPHPAFGPQFKLTATHAVVKTVGKVIAASAGAASAPKTMVRQTGGWQHS